MKKQISGEDTDFRGRLHLSDPLEVHIDQTQDSQSTFVGRS